MPRQTRRARAIRGQNAAMRKINRKASEHARHLCELIVQEIQANPATPVDVDRRPGRSLDEHLRDSYYVTEAADGSGDWVVKTDRRYWRFVEFGTREHGDAQPHIRPAIEIVRRLFT